ncbi:helix-turn-helix transcriptional regulator [Intestinimonas massiliensis (ex Afouda et al. 2020)]|uniref:helix-turn-helix transcriptional regulator n=1 Tax=Intestinimonas massiliensis (ex Afouda et al. 2020) TaxID=1673721 RepID=UPI0010317096|nr:LuxR C-terminal-related transcriptional regulator [Intestinimonas massiliensis (ex Afouda et al. 2020)]
MEQLYFSEETARKLSGLHECGLSMMEAPAGYGKTTAVRWAMRQVPPEQIHWFIAVSFLQDTSLDWFIRQIGQLDADAGVALRRLGFLNRSNVSEAADILAGLSVPEPCYLILDNFQLIGDNWPMPLLQALADRRRDGLRVILISQNFGRLRAVFEHTTGVCRFSSRDLLLSRKDIGQYGRQLGLELSRQQVESIYRNTEGWAAAVALYFEHLCREGGGLPEFRDMDALLEEFFWRRLSPEERELLLRVAVFDCIRAEQLPQVAPGREEELESLLVRIPLMHHDQRERASYPHELLRHFLLGMLSAEPAEFRSRVYETAGEIYRRAGSDKKAVECFFQAGNDEEVLSCGLTGLLNEKFGDVSYTALAQTVLGRCPADVLERHPLSMLRLCLTLFAGTDFGGFERELERCRAIVAAAGDPQLMGEWHMVAAFRAFPDLPGMKAEYLEAEKLMTAPSRIFTKREPFLFGTPSMWYLFYRTPGKMMETAEELTDMLEVYDRLTDHHGAGACELYLGEALSVQGKFDESDIYAHKAALLSERWENATVTYGAALLLGINAIYQSDMISLQKAIEYLENKALAYPFLQHTAINTLMAETVRGYLLGLMMEPDRSAEWTRGPADMLNDLTFTNFMVKTNRITDLILRKEYKRAIASVEASLSLDSRLISLSTRNFMCVGLALCYLAIALPTRAAEWLDRSLTLAEQDHNYTFLACFRRYLSVLFLFPSIKKKHARAIGEIKALDIHYTKAEESRIFSMLEKYPEQMGALTEREREVARLAASGMRNKEIAARLYISEETVKSHIRSIFNKTNIDRRSHLVDLLK